MRKVIAVSIFFVFIISSLFADTFVYDIFKYSDSFAEDGSVLLTSCTPNDEQTILVIPEEIDSKPVTGISSGFGFWIGISWVLLLPVSANNTHKCWRKSGDSFR